MTMTSPSPSPTLALTLCVFLTVVAVAVLTGVTHWHHANNENRLMHASPSQTLAVHLYSAAGEAAAATAGATGAANSTRTAKLVQGVHDSLAGLPFSLTVDPNPPFPQVCVAVPEPGARASAVAALARAGFQPIRDGRDLVPTWDRNAVVRVRPHTCPTLSAPPSTATKTALRALDALRGPGHYLLAKPKGDTDAT